MENGIEFSIFPYRSTIQIHVTDGELVVNGRSFFLPTAPYSVTTCCQYGRATGIPCGHKIRQSRQRQKGYFAHFVFLQRKLPKMRQILQMRSCENGYVFIVRDIWDSMLNICSDICFVFEGKTSEVVPRNELNKPIYVTRFTDLHKSTRCAAGS
jgi:hypothetical protein